MSAERVGAERVARRLHDLAGLLTRTAAAESARIVALAERYAAVLRAGGTLYFAGNGGSAADAQHLATEYVVRLGRTRRAFAAVALTTDTSVLTAAGNDLGFEQIFARQVEALCRPGDLLILHSTSGASANMLAAARAAHGTGVGVVVFSGKGGGPLAALADELVVVASHDTTEIQLLHLGLQHLVAELVEDLLLESSPT